MMITVIQGGHEVELPASPLCGVCEAEMKSGWFSPKRKNFAGDGRYYHRQCVSDPSVRPIDIVPCEIVDD